MKRGPLSLHDVEALVSSIDWLSIAAQAKSLWADREGRYSPLSMIKAFLLPFLLPISSEHALADELLEKTPLAVVCGFIPQLLPTRAMLWHFRHHESDIFVKLMPIAVASLVFAAAEMELELPFVTQYPVDRLSWNSAPVEFHIFKSVHVRLVPKRSIRSRIGLFDEGDHAVEDQPAASSDIGMYSKLGFPYLATFSSEGAPAGRVVINEPPWLGESATGDLLAPIVRSWRQTPYVATHVIISRKVDGERQILAGIARTGSARGAYTLPGGTIRADESIKECVAREVFEETGLEVLKSRPVSFFFTHFADRPWVVNIVATAYRYRGEVRNQEKMNFESWTWLSLSDIPNRVSREMFKPSNTAIDHFLRHPLGHPRWDIFEENVRGIELAPSYIVPEGTLLLPLWKDLTDETSVLD